MLDTLSKMQDRRLELVELAGDRLERHRGVVLGRRFLHKNANGRLSDYPPFGFKDLRSLLGRAQCNAVLLREFAVTR